MTAFFQILPYVRIYQKQLGLSLFFSLLAVVFSLVSLTMIIPFLRLLFNIDAAIITKPTLELTVDSLLQYFNYTVSQLIVNYDKSTALLFICGIVLMVFVFKNLFLYLGMYCMVPLRTGVTADLRNQMYQRLLQLPLSYFSNERKGDLITRMSTDAQLIETDILNALLLVFREPLNLIVFLIAMFWISPSLTLFVLFFLPVSGFIISRIGQSLKRDSQAGQQKLGYLMSIIEETLGGIKVIKAFNAQPVQQSKFQSNNQQYQNIIKRLYKRKDLASPLSEVLGIGVVVAVLWYGGSLVLNQKSPLPAEVFIAFIVIFSQLIQPAKKLVAAFYNIQKGAASLERIEAVLQSELTINETSERHKIPLAVKPIKNVKQGIEFKNVSFAYDQKPTLQQINFTIKRGEIVALVGQSGAGKSTVADLLARFYEVHEGAILIDGVNIQQYALPDLRNLMGIVSQQPVLFNDTVFNNIAFGLPTATQQAVEEAAKIAHAHTFIQQLQKGYQTHIGEGGNTLSGGEKQRLSLARAILRNPPILLLDEATSALDAESEQLVQQALQQVMQNRTTLVIAHRLSTIQKADKILVMQQGSIIEQGNHQSLLQQNGTYKKLVAMQAM